MKAPDRPFRYVLSSIQKFASNFLKLVMMIFKILFENWHAVLHEEEIYPVIASEGQ